ncbi:MAG TPA: FAD-dependent oxidoreductase [Bryobacteraceae bacterium]|nr:FAD-dependent oxidoreductase [Bryobacteraceae bacterium]
MLFRLTTLATVLALCAPGAVASDEHPDVLVIGAGVAGLATALEAANQGASVAVVEMSSIFGGHALMSEGGLALVATSTQAKLGVRDSVAIARQDFLRWGEDPNVPWVDRYVRESSTEVHDWLVEMGLKFTVLRKPAGNSVPRFHENAERGLGVAKVLFLKCLQSPRIRFHWNTQATGLVRKAGRVAGAECLQLRTGRKLTIPAGGVVLATGGFQSNLDLLRRHWPSALTFPERMLVGSGVNSTGSGHAMAASAGADLVHMNRQWNYPWGLPDPRYPDGVRGISVRMPMAIWVNKRGERFVDEHAGPKVAVPALLAQPGATYWAVFDATGKDAFVVAGTDWTDRRRVLSLLLNNPDVVKSGNSIAELARVTGVPEDALARTVDRFNQLVETGVDADFGRFGKGRELEQASHRRAPARILTPPYYAIQLYPLSRKSMGGIATDDLSRVLDKTRKVIAGLYAVGEAAGQGGLNGVAALEGTFLAPGILQGRIVGRQFQRSKAVPVAAPASGKQTEATPVKAPECQACHNVSNLIAKPRPGYWHFERVHTRVLERKYPCIQCHLDMTPFRPASHMTNRSQQAAQCAFCHLAAE